MSERYCGFILIMPGKNRMSIAWQTRISIARRCLPKAGTSASWYEEVLTFDTITFSNLLKQSLLLLIKYTGYQVRSIHCCLTYWL